nr:hypothetical protein [Streptomyces sp. QL37]
MERAPGPRRTGGGLGRVPLLGGVRVVLLLALLLIDRLPVLVVAVPLLRRLRLLLGRLLGGVRLRLRPAAGRGRPQVAVMDRVEGPALLGVVQVDDDDVPLLRSRRRGVLLVLARDSGDLSGEPEVARSADALSQILTWRDAEELFSLSHFIGVTRPGHLLTDDGLPKGGVSLMEVPALAISSTDCRARVAQGEPVWYLVPDGVVRYIDKRQLYRGE